ncbi:MFS transporter [Georgenia subflava]|uniref:MFS transporter n=1 Tax=Georgenia subflava TaxID=1622177 RepID=UPI001D02EEF6|nr:MFS transporter [Georgenia subflava]
MTNLNAPEPPPVSELPPEPAPRRTIAAWSLWDLGSNAFNTVILSFVFSVYVTGTVAADPENGQQVYSNAQTVAGILVALLAPLMGAWADRVRNRRLLLTIATLGVVASMAAMWFVKPENSYLLLGVTLIALASVIAEIAGVFYNGMLLQISSPTTVGRISGTAWALGYVGGVVALVIALFGFILDGGMLGVPTEDAQNARAVALLCAGWFLVFSIPVMVWGPREVPDTARVREPFRPLQAYRDIIARVVRMWRTERHLLHFLLSSAVYRDGLGAVFAFAGVIAATSYGMDTVDVAVFGIAANVIAAIGTWVFGKVDDRVGPRPVIVGALTAMIVFGLIIVAFDSTAVFWVFGMGIAALVGAVQSASRTLLTRMMPADEANETFGLYATAGRAVSFISPALIAIFTAVAGARMGMLGIVLTLALGLLAFWPLRVPGLTSRAR